MSMQGTEECCHRQPKHGLLGVVQIGEGRAASARPTAMKHGPAQLYLPVEAKTGCGGGQGHDHSASL